MMTICVMEASVWNLDISNPFPYQGGVLKGRNCTEMELVPSKEGFCFCFFFFTPLVKIKVRALHLPTCPAHLHI